MIPPGPEAWKRLRAPRAYIAMRTLYFCPVVSSSIFFFSSPNLSRQPSEIGCLPYFHTWCGLSANLGCTSETCCTRLAENTGRKNRLKFAICAPSYNFVGLYLRNWGTYRQSEKAFKQQYLLQTSPQYGELRPLAAEIGPVVWGTQLI